MAGIKQPILDICNRLRTILVPNGEGGTMTPHVRIWNNQTKREIEGKLYDFPKPAFFVEVLNSVTWSTLGDGMKSAELGFRIHIVHEYYDAQDGTFEQDLPVFDLRDQVDALLTRYEPTATGPLVMMNEEFDYEHTNIYEYLMDFGAHNINSKGSPLDPDSGKYIDSTSPLTMELNVDIVESIPNETNIFSNQPFKIPK